MDYFWKILSSSLKHNNMLTINPYLNFLGNTEEAFLFYKSVFGGEFSTLQRFSDIPGAADHLPEADKHKLMHVALPIGEACVLMGTDALESAGHKVTMGNNISLSINAESEAHADKLYAALSQNGVAEMPMEKTFWGAYFGMCDDQFGLKWMINYDYPN